MGGSPYAHGRSESRERSVLAAAAKRERRRLGYRLAELRAARELTQAEAAEAAGLHPVQISRIEGGKVNATVSTLVALSVTYGVRMRDLFE